MKSLIPSLMLRRTLLAAGVILTTGATAALAQSSSSSNASGAAQNSSSMSQNANSSMHDEDGSMSSMDSSSMQSGSDKLNHHDKKFIKEAAEGGEKEVALGNLAQQKSSNPDIKAFGAQLVRDHEQANAQLQQIAQQDNVKLDRDSHKKDHMVNKLSDKSGEDFDRTFINHMVDDHKKDVKKFEKEAQDAKDPAVRQFASTVLPKLRDHLATAERIKQSLTMTGHSGANSWTSKSMDSNTSPGFSSSGTATTGQTTNQGTTPDTTGSAGATSTSGAAGASSSSTTSTAGASNPAP